jgi:hypothetical protein
MPDKYWIPGETPLWKWIFTSVIKVSGEQQFLVVPQQVSMKQ